jgi:hypothetical protein
MISRLHELSSEQQAFSLCHREKQRIKTWHWLPFEYLTFSANVVNAGNYSRDTFCCKSPYSNPSHLIPPITEREHAGNAVSRE